MEFRIFLTNSAFWTKKFGWLFQSWCDLWMQECMYLADGYTTNGSQQVQSSLFMTQFVGPSIIWYSFSDLKKMKSWAGLAVGGDIWRSDRMTSKGNLTLGGSHGSTTVYPLMVDIKFIKIHWLWNDLPEQKTNFENWLCQSISWLFLNFYYLNVNSQFLFLSFTFFSFQWSLMIRVLDY